MKLMMFTKHLQELPLHQAVEVIKSLTPVALVVLPTAAGCSSKLETAHFSAGSAEVRIVESDAARELWRRSVLPEKDDVSWQAAINGHLVSCGRPSSARGWDSMRLTIDGEPAFTVSLSSTQRRSEGILGDALMTVLWFMPSISWLTPDGIAGLLDQAAPGSVPRTADFARGMLNSESTLFLLRIPPKGYCLGQIRSGPEGRKALDESLRSYEARSADPASSQPVGKSGGEAEP